MTLETRLFEKALYRVLGIADRKSKSSLAILMHVLLETVEPQRLRVSATDTDVTLISTYEAQVHSPGSVLVQARQLYEIIKSISVANVQLKGLSNHWLEIRADNSKFTVPGAASADFPSLLDAQQVRKYPLPSTKFMQMIERTLFCVSTDDSRYNLGGIFCISPKAGSLRMVSTDGHRLAWAQAAFDSTLQHSTGVIVPRKAFQELKRLVGDGQGVQHIQIGFNSNSMVFEVANMLLTTRLIDAEFPDYTQVIPAPGDKVVKLERQAFAAAVRRVGLLANSQAHGIHFHFKSQQLVLSASDTEAGEAQETLPVEYQGDDLEVAFNAHYILEALALMHEQSVQFELADNMSPGVLRPLEDRSFLAVVMPLRL